MRAMARTASKSEQVRELLRTGLSAADIAKKVGCTRGLVYTVKSTSGKATKRGPGRPRKAGARANVGGLEGILAAVKDSDRERAQMRMALERIQAVVADALR
jgi:transposase-like protein